MIIAVSNIYLTKTKLHIEIKLMLLEGELKKLIVACSRTDITPTMSTRSTTIDMAVKW
jgi:hypothetical protein